ncbi:MAG: hypothetical protein QXL51_00965 [Candidatus Aenigmatarchaeota archaeon]
MVKVLKSKRKGNVDYITSDGRVYWFSDTPARKSMEIIINDKDAEDLLKRYPNDLIEVKEKDWPEIYKQKVAEYEKSRLNELKKLFPDIKLKKGE